MKIEPPQGLKKGKFGYVMDLRRSIQELSEVSSSWCKAFDLGDDSALRILGEELIEIGLVVNATTEVIVAIEAKESEGPGS